MSDLSVETMIYATMSTWRNSRKHCRDVQSKSTLQREYGRMHDVIVANTHCRDVQSKSTLQRECGRMHDVMVASIVVTSNQSRCYNASVVECSIYAAVFVAIEIEIRNQIIIDIQMYKFAYFL